MGVNWIHLAQDRDPWGGFYEYGNELSIYLWLYSPNIGS
jgi:hypothetical protein